MTFSESIQKGFNNFFNPYGRASRSEFWWYYLCLIIVAAVLGVIGGFLESYGIEQVWIGIIVQVLSLVLVVSLWIAEIRRMHDIGKSGWNTCWTFIPLIGFIIVLYFLCKPSDQGENQYGPQPR